MDKILKIGHRGAKAYVAENTIESFEKAFDMFADGIEFDVHLSADGEIIVIHDETVDRTTNGSGFVKALSLPQIKALRIQKAFRVPTLAEVIATTEFGLINIELKVNDATIPTARLIEKHVKKHNRKYSQFLVSSFDWNALKELREYNPSIPLGVLTETDLDLATGFSEYIQAETIHPHFLLLTAENTAAMQRKGLKVFPWTVNVQEDISRMKSYKVNGIITDFPDRL
jgi:glycerophosphoryl diester phosphodiesterase